MQWSVSFKFQYGNLNISYRIEKGNWCLDERFDHIDFIFSYFIINSDTLFLYLIEIWKLSSNEFLSISNSNFENNQGWKSTKGEKPER